MAPSQTGHQATRSRNSDRLKMPAAVTPSIPIRTPTGRSQSLGTPRPEPATHRSFFVAGSENHDHVGARLQAVVKEGFDTSIG